MAVDAPACPTCGRRLAGAEADPKLHRTVKRRVRAGHVYGYAKAGAVVEVEARDIAHPAVASSTMSEKDWQAEQAAAKQRATAVADAQARGPVAELADRYLAAARARVEQQVRQRAVLLQPPAPAPDAEVQGPGQAHS